jgi:hypothetical protein
MEPTANAYACAAVQYGIPTSYLCTQGRSQSAAMLNTPTKGQTCLTKRRPRSRRASSVEAQVDLLESGRLTPPTAILRWLV